MVSSDSYPGVSNIRIRLRAESRGWISMGPHVSLNAVMLAIDQASIKGRCRNMWSDYPGATPRTRLISELMWGKCCVVEPRLHATPEVKRKKVLMALQCTPRTHLTSELTWGKSRERAVCTRICKKRQ